MNEAERNGTVQLLLFRDPVSFHLVSSSPVFSKWDFYETISPNKIVLRSYPKRQ